MPRVFNNVFSFLRGSLFEGVFIVKAKWVLQINTFYKITMNIESPFTRGAQNTTFVGKF